MTEPEYIDGITVLGGEPFEPENQRELYPFLKEFRKKFPLKSIWAYSGFYHRRTEGWQLKAYCEVTDEILSLIDVLVDGKFEEEKERHIFEVQGIEQSETHRYETYKIRR